MNQNNIPLIIRSTVAIPLIAVAPFLEIAHEVIHHSEAPRHILESDFSNYNNLRNIYISGANDTSSVQSGGHQFIINS